MTINQEEWTRQFLEQEAVEMEEIESLRQKELLDEDGYPTDAAHRIVEIWNYKDPVGWFSFIESIWHLASWGWHSETVDHEYREGEKVIRYNISTAGWSGNESLLRSMEENYMLWNTTWVQSRRGGHYIFEVNL